MKRFFFYTFIFFVVAPCIKMYTDILTDNTTGPLYIAADNYTINGAPNPLGHYLLLLWEAMPWLIGIIVIIEIFRWAGGRKQNKQQQPPPMQ